MSYPLPTNFGNGITVTAAEINNWSSLINTIWLLLAGVPVMPVARVATVGTETFTVAAGSVTTINGTTIDGVSVAVGDYVLDKDSPPTTGTGSPNSTQPGNGLYQVTAVTTNISLSRATQMSAAGGAATPAGMVIPVMAGTVNGGLAWEVSSPSSSAAFTYGTTPIAFSQAWVTPAGVQTFTNKRVKKRVGSVASAATPAINTDSFDIYQLSAQATPITGWTITGTPQHGDTLDLEITDNGTAQSILWTGFPLIPNGATSLPNVTPLGKKMTLRLKYDSARSTWVLMASDVAGY